MSALFSYCIPIDGGGAPNPFWGLCTLAICKPRIRRSAKEGDWVVGTGSVNSPVGDVSGKVVYAMRVTQKMTMEDYDRFTQSELPRKIPLVHSADPRRRCGDSIYDFSTLAPSLRPGWHCEKDRSADLSGGWVLLSNHFFYFGDKPVALPEALLGIVKQGRGHRSSSNTPYVDDFVCWIHSLGYPPAALIGKPQEWTQPNSQAPRGACGTGRRQEAEANLAEPDSTLSNPADTQGGNPGIDPEARVGHSLTVDLQRTRLKGDIRADMREGTGDGYRGQQHIPVAEEGTVSGTIVFAPDKESQVLPRRRDDSTGLRTNKRVRRFLQGLRKLLARLVL